MLRSVIARGTAAALPSHTNRQPGGRCFLLSRKIWKIYLAARQGFATEPEILHCIACGRD
jgi:hypothetical protein